jgi:para-aminobenzoate synthetase/4-amino-4-deoxychorismate lyase
MNLCSSGLPDCAVFPAKYDCDNACRAEKRRATMQCGAIWGCIKHMGHSVPERRPVVILDDATGSERRYSDPIGIIRADCCEEVDGAFAAIEQALADGHYVAGYFSYELGYLFERKLLPLLPATRPVPLLWFGIFAASEIVPVEQADKGLRTHASALAHEWDGEKHCAAFEHVHALICAGDLYQANVSYRTHFAFAGDPHAFYRALKEQSGARHCAYVDDGARQILSLSPELFFAIDTCGRTTVRPMKGTAARGLTAEADLLAVAGLRASEKERAENLMIVDLLRNDLAKVAVAGSVCVDCLFGVETYPTLHQMVSSISAQRAAPANVASIVRALFPCGSVTGAPKHRAMEVIHEVETSQRGIYCGAIGHFAPDGSAHFNVAIRTLTIADGRGELGIGSAVVHDSRAGAEYEECRLKARFFDTVRQPLRLIETLRYTRAEGFVRGALHLSRMERSADVLGLPFDREHAWRALEAVVRGGESARVRLLLDEDGSLRVETAPLAASPALWRYAISPHRVDSRDPLLKHKTSRRDLFDGELRRAAEQGCDEILFLNEKDELTEGSRSNIFVERDERLFTPHIDCGLLDGCLRRELLDQKDCIEARLARADLETADRVFLGNSLRGLIPARAA